MTQLEVDKRAELWVAVEGLYCGCGNPEDALELIHELLRVMNVRPLERDHDRLDELLPTSGIKMIVLQALTEADLLEHGGNIGGSWPTEKGERVLAVLEQVEAEEGYEAFVDSERCVHGFTREDDHDCMTYEDRS